MKPGFFPYRASIALFLILAACGGYWMADHSKENQSPGIATTGRRSALARPEVKAFKGSPAPSAVPNDLPMDRADSSQPVEAVVAKAQILDTRLTPWGSEGSWRRTRLIKSGIQPRLLRVEEDWKAPLAQEGWTCQRRDLYVADQVIVRVRPKVLPAQLNSLLLGLGMAVVKSVSSGAVTVRLPRADLDAMPEALAQLAKASPWVEAVEADGVGFGAALPNDTRFGEQWGCINSGQYGGKAGADIGALGLWDVVQSAPGIVIAVLDSGFNFNHPDLQGINWQNPDEIAGDGVDNDHDGKVDDVKGWNFVSGGNDPMDDCGHGSAVSGTIAAVRDNHEGTAGLISGARILPCKILNANNSGYTSDLIAAVAYARQKGVPVMNLSLQNYPFSSALDSEFTACEEAGILLCTCAGNQGVNIDLTPCYPGSYAQDNIITVGNHDRLDIPWAGKVSSSNFGVASVDIFAPGREILAPDLGSQYVSYTGTSLATPYVTAVAAVIKYVNPDWKAPEIKAAILNSAVAKAAYGGVCATGGRLNALGAVGYAIRAQPTRDSDGDGFPNFLEYMTAARLDNVTSKPQITYGKSANTLRLDMPVVAREKAVIQIETSQNLRDWTTAGVTNLSKTGKLSGSISVNLKSRGFLRVNARPTQ